MCADNQGERERERERETGVEGGVDGGSTDCRAEQMKLYFIKITST